MLAFGVSITYLATALFILLAHYFGDSVLLRLHACISVNNSTTFDSFWVTYSVNITVIMYSISST